MVNAFLFDFDGTFADTAFDLIDSANFIFTKYKKRLISYEEGREVASDGSRALLSLRFEPEKLQDDALINEFLSCYTNNLLKNPILFDGIVSLLELIRKKNFKWGVITNKPREFTEKILDHHNLLNSIDVLICGNDGYKTKPSPDMILEASSMMGLNVSDIVYIGDAQRDIDAANDAGTTSILACYGYLKKSDIISEWGADRLIHAPLDLSEIFDLNH